MNYYIESYKKDEKSQSFLVESFKKMKIENGIARWDTNNRVINNDSAEFAKYLGYEIDLEKMNEIRKKETNAFLSNYKKQMKNHVRSEEEIFEMRAAFGVGSTIIDVITGEKIKL